MYKLPARVLILEKSAMQDHSVESLEGSFILVSNGIFTQSVEVSLSSIFIGIKNKNINNSMNRVQGVN